MINHLIKRHLFIKKYNGITFNKTTVTFPLWNLSGQYVGYQRYNPNGNKVTTDVLNVKYHTYITKNDKTTALTAWGLDVLDATDRIIYLVEGIFKACRLHNYGLNALAVLGNDPKHLRSWINSLGYRIIPVCDGDVSGKKLAKYGPNPIYLPDGYYLDEMSNREMVEFIDSLQKARLNKCK